MQEGSGARPRPLPLYPSGRNPQDDLMPRWLKYAVPLAVLALILFGAYRDYTTQQALSEARGAMWHSQQMAKADSARADSAEARADSAEARAAAHMKAAKVIYVQAPDTCKPYIAQATKETKRAYHEEKKAAAELRARGDILQRNVTDLSKTSQQLVAASRPSFWSHLVPQVGVGAAAGIDPITRKPATAVGVTLSWRIH